MSSGSREHPEPLATESGRHRLDPDSFYAAIRGAPDAILIADIDAIVVFFNRAAEQILGWSEDEVVGKSLDLFVQQERTDDLDAWRDEFYEGGSFVDSDTVYQCLHKDGSMVPVRLSIELVDAEGASLMVAVFRDVTDRIAYEWELQQRATHDALTGLPNSSLFFELLETAVGRSASRGGLVAVVQIDIDRFADVNERHGQTAGDELLNAIGQRILDVAGTAGDLARGRGDRFFLIVDEVADAEDVVEVAELVLAGLNEDFVIAAGTVNITASASAGVALGRSTDASAERLLRGQAQRPTAPSHAEAANSCSMTLRSPRGCRRSGPSTQTFVGASPADTSSCTTSRS